MKMIGRNKKLVYILVIALIVTLVPIMSFAGDDDNVGKEQVSQKGVGFHCCGDVIVTNYKNDKYQNGDVYSNSIQDPITLVYIKFDGKYRWTIKGDEGTFTCNKCNNTTWISKSNQSGVPFKGKNVQLEKGVSQTEIDEPLYGDLALTKVDFDDGTTLGGVTFSLVGYDENTSSYSAVKTTDLDGEILWPNLVPGEYVLTETNAADDYDKDTLTITDPKAAPISKDSYKITIAANDYLELTATNKKTNTNIVENTNGSVTITKVDAVDGTTLAGVKFALSNYGETLSYVSEQLTDTNGSITWPDLAPGKYLLTEIDTIEGYNQYSLTVRDLAGSNDLESIASNQYRITVRESVDLDLIATNSKLKKGTVVLSKNDVDTTLPISGAAFSLANDLDGLDKIGMSDEFGKVTWTNLEPGTYTLYEILASSGYDINSFTIDGNVIDENGYEFTVKEGETVTIDATNKKSSVQGKLETDKDGSGVLPDLKTPKINTQKVLGAEAKTSDSMNVVMVIIVLLAALAVAGGFMARRKLESTQK